MDVRLAFLDKARAYCDRERQIREATAVQMPELPPSDAELDPAISMG
jgi:hypothetical protein